MKPLSEQDYYETLEIPRDADREAVERAYRLARSTYAPDSLAGYSVFDDGDLELLQERVELAYRTLSDADARSAYDRELEQREGGRRDAPRGAEETLRTDSSSGAPRPTAGALDGFDELDDSEGEWSGGRLRRMRLRSGVELEEIAKTTKVNPAYLAFIEDERFAELPAAVYVRGFVMGYASCIGLDPKRVAASYMRRLEESREGNRRRLFSRR